MQEEKEQKQAIQTLYKRGKKGEILEWNIVEVLGINNGYNVVFGQLDGKSQSKFTKVEIKNIGKLNETSIEEQVKSEVNSKINSQKDKGYKSIIDLGGEALSPFKNIRDLIDYLNENLKESNTDANGEIKCMLANSVKKDYSNVTFPCYIQPKLDGLRCLLILEMIEGSITLKFISRNGKTFDTLSHIAADILDFVKSDYSGERIVLDGELYSDEIGFQEILSAVKKKGENTHKIKFRCYDIINSNQQGERIANFQDLCDKIKSNNIVPVDTFLCYNIEQAKNRFSEFIQKGYEGAMIRLPNGKYESGFRSSSLLKLKEFDEDEFQIIDLILGDRGIEDLIVECLTKDGKKFRAKSMGTTEYKKEVHKAFFSSRINKDITIKFFGWTNDKLPRFPVAKIINRKDYE